MNAYKAYKVYACLTQLSLISREGVKGDVVVLVVFVLVGFPYFAVVSFSLCVFRCSCFRGCLFVFLWYFLFSLATLIISSYVNSFRF